MTLKIFHTDVAGAGAPGQEHDLWQARQTVDLDAVERIDFRAA